MEEDPQTRVALAGQARLLGIFLPVRDGFLPMGWEM